MNVYNTSLYNTNTKRRYGKSCVNSIKTEFHKKFTLPKTQTEHVLLLLKRGNNIVGKFSSWERKGDSIILSVKIPEKIKATAYSETGFVFEDGTSSKEVSSGEYVIKRC